jgi:hypothetical protein
VRMLLPDRPRGRDERCAEVWVELMVMCLSRRIDVRPWLTSQGRHTGGRVVKE